MANCHISENPIIGPQISHTTMIRTALAKPSELLHPALIWLDNVSRNLL
jgi:hypothetical protein